MQRNPKVIEAYLGAAVH
ncbi:hypothetical protein C9I57_19940 [Trinickia symbiotica]|uniref:Branched-chain amino acid ATP-binding cassette transporter C-terminal domain-containing protein n=1 Tax=Trinickia symbiotica TaxID=863227 RepID=A0A2T3XR52_9BURK|nr:hypothetical protein C9I57_19940 [Trinickia symbiotica]